MSYQRLVLWHGMSNQRFMLWHGMSNQHLVLWHGMSNQRLMLWHGQLLPLFGSQALRINYVSATNGRGLCSKQEGTSVTCGTLVGVATSVDGWTSQVQPANADFLPASCVNKQFDFKRSERDAESVQACGLLWESGKWVTVRRTHIDAGLEQTGLPSVHGVCQVRTTFSVRGVETKLKEKKKEKKGGVVGDVECGSSFFFFLVGIYRKKRLLFTAFAFRESC